MSLCRRVEGLQCRDRAHLDQKFSINDCPIQQNFSTKAILSTFTVTYISIYTVLFEERVFDLVDKPHEEI